MKKGTTGQWKRRYINAVYNTRTHARTHTHTHTHTHTYTQIIFFFQISQFKHGELLRVQMESKENLKKELQRKRTEVSPCSTLCNMDTILIHLYSVGATISGKD